MTQRSFATAAVQTSTTVTVVSRKKLFRCTQILADSIAQRAYELYGNRGYAGGEDSYDWMQAESELLTSLKIDVFDTGEYVIVRADISEFGSYEIRVCVESTILRIVGTPKDLIGAIVDFSDSNSTRLKQLLHVAELPNQVDATHVVAIVTESTMEIVMPKVAKAMRVLQVTPTVA